MKERYWQHLKKCIIIYYTLYINDNTPLKQILPLDKECNSIPDVQVSLSYNVGFVINDNVEQSSSEFGNALYKDH